MKHHFKMINKFHNEEHGQMENLFLGKDMLADTTGSLYKSLNNGGEELPQTLEWPATNVGIIAYCKELPLRLGLITAPPGTRKTHTIV